jgi:hypothetical protein
MLSRYRHRSLVEPLTRHRRPVLRRGPFSLYWLTTPEDRTPTLEAELVIVHDLPLERIDNNAGKYVRHDLLPMVAEVRATYGPTVAIANVWSGTEHEVYSMLVASLVYSVHADARVAWRWFYRNTLDAPRSPEPAVADPTDFIAPFAAIYQRVAELREGSSLLDVGTAHGFLPLLFAMGADADAPA